MSKRKLSDLGPWASDNFAKTVNTSSTVGVDSDLPDVVRFLAGVAKLIRRRLAEAGDSADPSMPAVFLLMPNAHVNKLHVNLTRIPMLNNGLTVVNGRLWFVSPVPVMGSYVELKDCDDDKLFRIVSEDLELGNVPAVIYDPRTKAREIRFYENGLDAPEICESISMAASDVALERIFEVINRIHERTLITPDAQQLEGKLWCDNTKHWPVKNAERVIQLYLYAGLTAAFLNCTVRAEQNNVSGRLDLEIEESDPIDRSIFVRHALLELKVLRSFGSTGDIFSEKYNLDWVESGVNQAASYRKERGARASALCCFDMRKENSGEECFTHVSDLAQQLKVALRVWFLYATSKQYRDAVVSEAKSW